MGEQLELSRRAALVLFGSCPACSSDVVLYLDAAGELLGSYEPDCRLAACEGLSPGELQELADESLEAYELEVTR